MNIAQLLQRFHVSSVEDNGNSRTLKLYKQAKNARAGTIENTRLGRVEGRIAERFDTRFKEIGLEKQYGKSALAKYEGMTLNQEKFTEHAQSGSDFKGLKDDEFKLKFKEQFKVELTGNNGEFRIAPSEKIFNYFESRRINSLMLDEAGTNKNVGAGGTRLRGKRDTITWRTRKQPETKRLGTV